MVQRLEFCSNPRFLVRPSVHHSLLSQSNHDAYSSSRRRRGCPAGSPPPLRLGVGRRAHAAHGLQHVEPVRLQCGRRHPSLHRREDSLVGASGRRLRVRQLGRLLDDGKPHGRRAADRRPRQVPGWLSGGDEGDPCLGLEEWSGKKTEKMEKTEK